MYPLLAAPLLLSLASTIFSAPTAYPEGVPVPGVPQITQQVAIDAGGGLPTSPLPPSLTDDAYDHLKLAVWLENLESYYFNNAWEGLSQGNFSTDVKNVLTRIGAQEKIHVATIEALLSAFNHTTVAPCNYTFPVSTTDEFLALGNLITSIGFGAAIQLAADLAVSDPGLVTVVGQTVAVESRHDAFFRINAELAPNPSPYDTAIPGPWAFSWFSQFADASCPSRLNVTYPIYPPLDTNGSLSLPALPSGPQTFNWSEPALLKNPLYNSSQTLYIGWNNQLNSITYTPLNITAPGVGLTVIPDGLSGMAIAVLTHNNTAQLASTLTPYILAGITPLTVS